jgi:hypothetical protein
MLAFTACWAVESHSCHGILKNCTIFSDPVNAEYLDGHRVKTTHTQLNINITVCRNGSIEQCNALVNSTLFCTAETAGQAENACLKFMDTAENSCTYEYYLFIGCLRSSNLLLLFSMWWTQLKYLVRMIEIQKRMMDLKISRAKLI